MTRRKRGSPVEAETLDVFVYVRTHVGSLVRIDPADFWQFFRLDARNCPGLARRDHIARLLRGQKDAPPPAA